MVDKALELTFKAIAFSHRFFLLKRKCDRDLLRIKVSKAEYAVKEELSLRELDIEWLKNYQCYLDEIKRKIIKTKLDR